MLPIRHRSIFRSRWIALLWAGGIVWAALQFSGTGEQATADGAALTDATGAPVDQADLRALEDTINAM